MKARVLLFAIALLGACDCDGGSLSRICPESEPCMIRENGQIVTGNLKILGECRTGTTAYSPGDCEESCEGWIGPADEVCDELDNDCDGFTDEDFDKDNDGFTECGGDCNDDNPDQFPGQTETCNATDDDCDGRSDEDLVKECWTGPADAALEPPSRCRTGTSSCAAGRWSYCVDQVAPHQRESCNLIDDDCDGEVDETELEFCGPQTTTGACTQGNQICDVDGESYCVGSVYPSAEICNGLDDDCDGITDEGLERLCQTICGIGEETCTSSVWGNCTAPIPEPEICDGLDNDCDGQADEDCPCSLGEAQTCRNGVVCGPVLAGPCENKLPGVAVNCGIGVTLCTIDGQWGPCEYWANDPEICNNWDDDCDSTIDGLIVPCGDPALDGVGECRSGTSSCSAGMWGPCAGGFAPRQEICDGLDNDCDNETDEDLIPHDKVDVWFVLDGSGSMCSKAMALEQGISVYANDFIDTEHHFGLGVYPGVGWTKGNWTSTVDVIIPPVDILSFIGALQSYDCNYGGIEPGWDAAFRSTDPLDPLMIGWRVATGTITGAYPYVIMITDESASQGSVNEASVTSRTTNCNVGACVPGDRWEFFVITPAGYWAQWDDPTFGEPERLIDIFPADAQRYTDVLRGILANVCR